MMTYSYSKFRKYGECPAAFKAAYIDHIPSEPSPELLRGNMVHRIISAYLLHLRENHLRTDITEMETIAEQVFYDPTVRRECPISDDAWEEVAGLADTFARTANIGPAFARSEMKMAVDHDLQPWPYEDPNVFIRAILDRLDLDGERAVIYDYKTGYHAEFNKLQAEVYCYMVFKNYPQVNIIIPIFHHIPVAVEKRGEEVGRDRLDGLEKKLRKMAAMIQADKEFAPTPGAACDDCPYPCPAKQSGLASIANDDGARAIAEDLILLDKQKKDKEKMLRDWCNRRGFVEVNGLVYGFHVSESQEFNDVGEFNATCQMFQRDPCDFLNVDNRKATKLLKDRDPKVAEKFQSIVSIEKSQKWGAKKAKEDES